MMGYPVNEIFETIQGEASWTGAPSLFIRLQGCDVGCPWCDTKHTWAIDPSHQVVTGAMLDKAGDGASWADMSLEKLSAAIAYTKARHVVITGGEPCVHDLTHLVGVAVAHNRTCQVETSGTERVRVGVNKAWVTLSPKIDMPGGKEVRHDAALRANEIKMPVGKPDDVEKLKRFLVDHFSEHTPPTIWLQPLSTSEKATALCVDAATENGWRISIQTHKFIGVR